MDSEMSLSNMVLSFLEDAGTERWPANDGGDDDDGAGDDAESKAFWQAQHSQLHVSPLPPFDRQSSVLRVRQEQIFLFCSKTTINHLATLWRPQTPLIWPTMHDILD